VNDAIEALSSKEMLHSLPVGYVGKSEAKAGSLHQPPESGPPEIHVIVFIPVVQAQHLLPIVKKPLGHVKADEAGAPGHENFFKIHSSTFCLVFPFQIRDSSSCLRLAADRVSIAQAFERFSSLNPSSPDSAARVVGRLPLLISRTA